MFSAKTVKLSLIALFCFLLLPASLAFSDELSQCALCHIDADLIDELTEDETGFDDALSETSPMQQGTGYHVKQAPFDLYEKVLVSEDFLSSPHGIIPCQLCHLGNPNSSDAETAHEGMISDPSINSQDTCGQCHDGISKPASNSLHINPAPLYATVGKRCSKEQMDTLKKAALDQQCLSCHQGSCGSCHVSRPDVSGGGLRSGHFFNKKPDFVYQCLACHAQPTGNDFIGKKGKGDIHYRKYKMTCSSCHSSKELHASADGANRYHLEQRAQCVNCHEEISEGPIPEHVLHKTLSCSICHAAPYQNCASCHIGTDKDGIPYSQSPPPTKGYKIGQNPDKTGPRYVLLREVGIDRDTFKDAAGKLENFSSVPTYKRASPHTIQRRTWQTADCNHCHGNKELFLTKDDISFDSIVANRHVLLKDSDVPEKVQARRSYILSPTHSDPEIRITAEWLKKHGKDKNIIILDTRTKKQYEQGHIPGAYHLCFCLFRTGAESTPPYMMQTPAELAKLFGGSRLGLSPEQRVIIYDDAHNGRGVTFLALKMLGHDKVSFLDGNLASWQNKGYKLAKGKAPTAQVKEYPFQSNDLIVNNQDIVEMMEAGKATIVDLRNVAQHNGDMVRDDIAKTGGALPKSLSFPLQSIIDSEGKFYPEDRLTWLLSTAGLSPSPSKDIITTCNTNMLAAELYMVLTYLGYNNVKVHDGSWAEWAAEYK
jgi:3-mercaptopyruvate sulfurtransferase SseA